ncbi:3'-5' exonuclease [Streptomyces sp. SDr-06]|uniref:3'-5' exonuclease n=1 Tax=Streptomyces sp. SDr-06 TaxID=2267702 RepID=UPI000DE8DA93|nr:3'-5' exonuclease [Streptomyces sp. SDr-06]RCH70524.1 3'-5' exonuclease [Streptomyces sp. SDr-06]
MSTENPPSALRPLAFIDTETTGLDPFLHDPWEIAVILRVDGHDAEHVYRILPDITEADPEALKINRYFERVQAGGWQWDDPKTAVHRLYALLNGAVVIGSNPAFDAEMLAHLFGLYYEQPRPWHYRTIDVATLAVGSLYGRAAEWTRKDCDADWYRKVNEAVGWPWKSYDASRHVEVEPPAAGSAHTALGDARWARDVYDAVTQPDAFYAASDEQLSQMAGDALTRFHGGDR